MSSVKRKFSLLFGATAVVIMTVSTGTFSAAAAERPAVETCWVDLATKASLCVPTGTDLLEAVVRERGIQLVVPEGTVIGGVPAHVSTLARSARAVQVTVTGILYDNVNYGGGSFVASSGGSCSSGSYGYTSLSPYGWNDRASSFRSYANCSSAVFFNENYSGASYGYYVNASSLGGLNDSASSWRMQ